jgi:5-methyltetrahydrofolate--homocysteine methyltransferase
VQTSPITKELQGILSKRIMFLDGAMGTIIQSYNLTEADFRGTRFLDHPKDLKGNNDTLVLTRPNIIEEIHKAYLLAGSDIIETNTFSANRISQKDYALENIIDELNTEAVRIAKRACEQVMLLDHTRKCYVAGAIGPTNITLSMSPHVNNPEYRAYNFTQLQEVYYEQIKSLILAGVDLLLPETTFDTLNLKACIAAIKQVEAEMHKQIPLILSVTITDKSGRTLSGQTIEAFWYSISHAKPLAVGINCALGAKDMFSYVQTLAKIADCYISCYPNAGLPNPLSTTGYDETPDDTANAIFSMAQGGLVNLVGGCCGTTPQHIEKIVKKLSPVVPRQIPTFIQQTTLSGLEALTIDNSHDPQFYMIGERTNVSGSPLFARLIREGNFSQALEIARNQVNNGANIIDINFDDGMLDSKACMVKFLNLIASEPDICKVPIMLDSSKFDVIEAGLQVIQGKGIVNSISLKEGEEEFLHQARIIQNYGAAVVIMAFDESGQATEIEHKVAICIRAYNLLTQRLNFNPSDIIFDVNILTVATGIEEHNTYALNFIKAVRQIKKLCPYSLTSGGVSNLSFSFRGNNIVREAMHSVFLFHAIQAGLDMAIVNAGMLTIYDEIEPKLKAACERVILNLEVSSKTMSASEELLELAQSYANKKTNLAIIEEKWRDSSIEERVSYALINGLDSYIIEDTKESLGKYLTPLSVIEQPLMNGMKEVGRLFGEGKMFLPQVVKSARVMKKAVAYLEPLMESQLTTTGSSPNRPVVVIATVKGDVHDIGKNIVALVLRCNGYEVLDLGVMVQVQGIIEASIKHNAAFIGLSGLITPSLEEMIYNVKEFERIGLKIPVLIGGATTSKLHTAVKIEPHYSGAIIHVNDASLVAEVCAKLSNPETRDNYISETRKLYQKLRNDHYQLQSQATTGISYLEAINNKFVSTYAEIATPKHLGVRKLEINCADLVKYIDWSPLFWAWGFKGLFPKILDHQSYGTEAQKIYTDAKSLLGKIIRDNLFNPQAVVGWWHAYSKGDDVIILDESGREIEKLCFLRQQTKLDVNHCLADYISPNGNDYIGAFVVTMGVEVEKLATQFEQEQDDYKAIMTKVIGDRLVEALAEYCHKLMRDECGYGLTEDLTIEDLIYERYRGIRPAPGYPACPEHSEKSKIWKLLNVDSLTGAHLTENFAMYPASTVSGYYFNHPQARYFALGKIGHDQVVEYATRKGISVELTEKWLAPSLNYTVEG